MDKGPKGAKLKEKIKQEKRTEKKERAAFFDAKKREERAKKQEQKNAFKLEKSEIKDIKNTKTTDKSIKKDFSKKTTKPDIKGAKPKIQAEKPVTPKKAIAAKEAKPAAPKKEVVKAATQPKTKTFKKDFNTKKATPVENDPGLPFKRKALKQIDEDKLKKAIIKKPKKTVSDEDSTFPLNKFIAHGGVCSRRDAGDIVKAGKVKVNGVVVTEPGYKVLAEDKVTINGKRIVASKNFVYILLNKPKDYITTADDPQGRKTVMDLIKTATSERVYPVGRLDRNTSGVLLLTNDGDLAQQLTHPSFQVRKIYEAKLDRALTKQDLEKLVAGVELEDGLAVADSVAYADSKDKSVVGIEIHNGKNRIVRRMFEHLGYDVKGLDRVMFANLTKKNVDRSKYRLLNEKEVRLLKFFKSAGQKK